MVVLLEEALTLTPEAAEELHKLLVGFYPDWSRLDMFLTFKLGKRLGLIASETQSIDVSIFRLVQKACDEAWCQDLVTAVIKDRPDNAAIQQWADLNLLLGARETVQLETPPESLMALDTSFFDLTKLRNAMEDALATRDRGIFGFGIPYPDLTFASKVCEWLPYCIGDVQRKEPLNLKPEFAPVARHINQVVRYRRDLMSSSIVCPVLAEGVPLEVIEKFWTGISNELAGIKNSLVVVIMTYPGAVLPAGVAQLPGPEFTENDITIWAREVVYQRKWPHHIAKLWSSYIVAEAQDGTGLDVRAVYEAMDRSIVEMRTNPSGFRANLEQGYSYAHTTSD